MNEATSVADCIELRPISGDTEVVIEGFTGLGLVVFVGGSKRAAEFKKSLTEIVESIVAGNDLLT